MVDGLKGSGKFSPSSTGGGAFTGMVWSVATPHALTTSAGDGQPTWSPLDF